MTKTTLIKDLYGEIDRLKAEVYAAREKNGVYIPKERYYQEESEKKAMADQIEHMGIALETRQKQIDDLQSKYTDQVRHCSYLGNKLDATEKSLNKSCELLANTQEELKKCQYTLKEKDFIISEQIKAENALAHQACVLQADLEKALKDNASLFSKIGREDKLNSDNKVLVNNFQLELAKQIGSLCNTLATSLSQQNEHLQCAENLCHSFLGIHDKAVIDLRKKVTALRALYISHLEAVQNVVRLHKASSDATLEEISSLSASNSQCIEEFLASEATEAGSIFEDVQSTLSTHQGELALFARELRHRFNVSVEQTKDISDCTREFVDKLLQESKRLENFASQADEKQTKSIAEFKKAYEEQSKSDAEKLIADVTSLVSSHIRRQVDLVDARLTDLRENGIANKSFLDGHVSSVGDIVTQAKRKWQAYCEQAEKDTKDTADYSAAKHCQMETLLQHSVNAAESVFKHMKRTHESVNEMETKHVSAMVSHVRDASVSNELHDAEINSARVLVEEDVAKNSENVLQQIDDMSVQERESIAGMLNVVKTHENTLETFREDHSVQATYIEEKARETFQQHYRDYEPSGTTPTRCEADVPSKGIIESLRSLPVEALVEEFRENQSYESFDTKELNLKPSLIPRSPLTQLNHLCP